MARVKLPREKLDWGACVPIQLKGKRICNDCPHKDIKKGDEACPSQEMRRNGKNSLGHTIPVQEKEA